eukprot:CAMPEP_0184331648 /NCGR_PEP_ID=MMETSP1089-20130417/932_1 /TAXON_ID=38269 ORGANISM="Gloeochaete wittrockiana, Strain SAG46.84" /NCGR_SAMPLE_ID=MMETSP1089 /ASSEMBLY_ACC=CAM_ASM_000445 /LENGTH=56 /DNA_ID=CAMNT_0026654659 /DNA_START=137 /DNA_END=307 /DNA_ORIENTATION=+
MGVDIVEEGFELDVKKQAGEGAALKKATEDPDGIGKMDIEDHSIGKILAIIRTNHY